MSLLEARIADRAGNLEEAARLYEDAIANGERALDVLLDLAALYWQATDPGSRSDHEFFQKAGRRMSELLDDVVERYPESAEARFWKQYIEWADLGGALTVEECEQLLLREPASLAPAMHVFSASHGTRMEREAHELLRRSRADGSTRARYVTSVIEATIRYARR